MAGRTDGEPWWQGWWMGLAIAQGVSGASSALGCCHQPFVGCPLWAVSVLDSPRPLVGLFLLARLRWCLSPLAGGLGRPWVSALVVPWFRQCLPRLRGVPRVEGLV